MHGKLVLAHKLDHKLVVNRSQNDGTRAAIVSFLSLAVLKTTRSFSIDPSVMSSFQSSKKKASVVSWESAKKPRKRLFQDS